MSADRTGRNPGHHLVGSHVAGDDGVSGNRSAAPNGHAAENHRTLAEEDIVLDRDGSFAVCLAGISTIVVSARNEDTICKHAAIPNANRVDGVQVNIVSKVAIVTENEQALPGLNLQPDTLVDGATIADLNTVDSAKSLRGLNNAAFAKGLKGAGVQEFGAQ
jgi:hypothetical protein